MITVKIDTEYIKLDQLLKLANVVGSGGQAKMMILSEDVMVNGVIEIQRGKKLRHGDMVEIDGEKICISSNLK